MKRVLILASWYPKHKGDIAGLFIARQAEALKGAADVQVVDCSQRFSILPRGLRLRLQACRIRRKLQKQNWKPDVIHAHVAYPAGVIGLLLKKEWDERIPLVLTEHTGPLRLLQPYFDSEKDFF